MIYMISEIQRVRPNYEVEDLLLHNRTGESSYLPTEFAPHTILASFAKRNLCEFDFEYQIDEDEDTETRLGLGIKVVFGKYTGKVLKLFIEFNSLNDLIGKIEIASNSLHTKKSLLNKESYKKHYDLVIQILENFEMDLLNNQELKQAVENAC